MNGGVMMGSFDTILLEEEICPVCKHYAKLEFQTKAFDRGLRTLRVPERLDDLGIDKMFQHINAILVNVIGTCTRCKSRIWGEFFIHDSMIISPLVITTKNRQWASSLVDYLTYFINHQARLGEVEAILDEEDEED